jgi:hypothetical protein
MGLKFIDVSSNNSIATAGMDGVDGVIVKVSQGTGYVNPDGDPQYQLAKSKKRLLGFYHYAGGGDPVAEANYFYANAKNYFYEAVPCLDWEEFQNSAWGSTTWCERFMSRIHDLTGVWPLLYTGDEGVDQNTRLAAKCGLWFAGYPDNRANWNVPGFNYNISPWKSYTLWQFTSSGGVLDREIAAVDAAGWKKIANPGKKSAAKPALKPAAKPTISKKETVAKGWKDTLGDTWYNEKGKFKLTQDINLRYGAKTTSALIATLKSGSTIEYDAFSHHNGYVWLRQPRGNGKYGYLASGTSNGVKRTSSWGLFSEI